MVDLEGRNFLLDPAHVRRNDTSAASINEWTGEKLNRSENISDDIQPDTIAPLGNYAVQILWQDGFNQVHRPRFCMAGLHALVVCSWHASVNKPVGHCHAEPCQDCCCFIDTCFIAGVLPAEKGRDHHRHSHTVTCVNNNN